LTKILFTKADLEEKAETLLEIQRQFDGLKSDHEYQLRLKDVNFNEKLKNVTDIYGKEIESLKSSTSALRTEKEKEDVKHQEQIQTLKTKNMTEQHQMDVKNNTMLMAEYERLSILQAKSSSLQAKWQKMTTEFQETATKTLEQAQAAAEAKLKAKMLDIQKLSIDLREKEIEFQEMKSQNLEDIDTEIELVSSKFDKKIKDEREEGLRLKGENGIMNKKFITFAKNIEESKVEIQKIKDNLKRHDGTVLILEKEILGLRKVFCY
jgi:cilia- and flagella-associated protein 57